MSSVSRSGRSAVDANVVHSTWPAVMPYRRGMQPERQDPMRLWKECLRLLWALRVLDESRSKTVILCDHQDRKRHWLRRELDAHMVALEAVDAEKFASVEEHRRNLDDPLRALEFATKEFL